MSSADTGGRPALFNAILSFTHRKPYLAIIAYGHAILTINAISGDTWGTGFFVEMPRTRNDFKSMSCGYSPK